MKLGLGLYRSMFTPEYLRFAKQAGVSHIVAHIPGDFVRDDTILTSDNGDYGFGFDRIDDPIWTYEGLRDLKAIVEEYGLELAAIENFAPHQWYDVLLDGPRRAEQIEHLKQIIRNMGRVGIPTLGYSFTITGVWGRTEGPFARGGAVSVGYENPTQTPIPNGMVWNMVYDRDLYDPINPKGTIAPVSSEEMWRRLEAFLSEILPVAEEAGVELALHPDDPPMPTLRGIGRLIHTSDGYDRLLNFSSSPSNKIEFCIGTLSEMADADIYDIIERYSRTGRISYVHFRNVRGKVPHYHETFIDDGDTDMVRALRILRDSGFDGVMIPDHTPLIECAAPWHAGVAYALGYMKAAIRLIQEEKR
jgi:mannonate dehydratase